MTRRPWVSYSSRWTSRARLAHESLVSFYAFDVTPWRAGGTRLAWIHKDPLSIARQGAWQVLPLILLKEVPSPPLTVSLTVLSSWECDGFVVKLWWDNASEAPGTRQELFLPEEGLLGPDLCLSQYPTHGSSSVSISEWMQVSLFGSWIGYLLLFQTDPFDSTMPTVLAHSVWKRVGLGRWKRPEEKENEQQSHTRGRWKALDVKRYFHAFILFKSSPSTWVSSWAWWASVSFLARDDYTRATWWPWESCHTRGSSRSNISHCPLPAGDARQA